MARELIEKRKNLIIGFSLLAIFILYLLLLSNFFVIEEILGFYLFPILLVIIVRTALYLITRKFKNRSYKKSIFNSLGVVSIWQLAFLILILWSAKTRYFSREEVVADIDYAIKIVEEVHPNMYTKIEKGTFIARANSLKDLLPLKVSDVEAYKTLRKTFSQIGDGHTGGGWSFFFNRMALFFRKTLPYKIEIINERLFVAKNYFYRDTIPVGSEIIEINGKPSKQCLLEIEELLSYESVAFRNSLLGSPLFWGLWNNFGSFEITYKAPNENELKTVNSSGGLISKLLAFSESAGKDFFYKVLPDNIGYMEFNSFKDLDKFKLFLDSTFRSIQANNVNHLIIDIRKNGGGNSSLGDELMQYISKRDFKMVDSCTIKLSSELINKGYFNWLDSTKRIGGSLYNSYDTAKVALRDNPLRFNGKTYLLIGGATFSSAAMLASSFQCYNVGEIIGSETGGLTACFGDVYSFELPNTRLDMGVSYKVFFNACGIDNGRGVIPNYVIETPLHPEQQSSDRVLEFTIDLIKKNLLPSL